MLKNLKLELKLAEGRGRHHKGEEDIKRGERVNYFQSQLLSSMVFLRKQNKVWLQLELLIENGDKVVKNGNVNKNHF